MSARIRVDKRPGFWRWECLDRTPGSHTWANRSDADVRWSQSEALQSGLAHLRDHHPETVWAAGGDVYAPTTGTYCREHGCARQDCAQDHDRTGSANEAVRPLESRTERPMGPIRGRLHTAHNLSREDC